LAVGGGGFFGGELLESWILLRKTGGIYYLRE
jgi:hypothetical protein